MQLLKVNARSIVHTMLEHQVTSRFHGCHSYLRDFVSHTLEFSRKRVSQATINHHFDSGLTYFQQEPRLGFRLQ